MERLTQWFGAGSDRVFGLNPELEEKYTAGELIDVLLKRVAAYEDTGLEPERVAELAKAEQDCRLLVLPCKTGDTIYQLREKRHAQGVGISPRIVSCAHVWSNGNYTLSHQGMTICTKKDLGKTWFLTREEAEATLKSKEGGVD